MVQLDAGDKRLLRLLQRDAGLSQVELADQAGMSPASCWRRLRAMEDKGVLGPLVRLIIPERIGLELNVICHIRMSSHAPEAIRDFEDYIERHEEVLVCLSMSGEWDYLLHIVVPSISAFENLLMQGLLRHPSVAHSASHFALKRVKYTTSLPV